MGMLFSPVTLPVSSRPRDESAVSRDQSIDLRLLSLTRMKNAIIYLYGCIYIDKHMGVLGVYERYPNRPRSFTLSITSWQNGKSKLRQRLLSTPGKQTKPRRQVVGQRSSSRSESILWPLDRGAGSTGGRGARGALTPI